MLPWDAFLDRYLPMARAIAEKLTGRSSDAEDLVQEATLALYAASRRDGERFADTAFARNYFFRTVRNLSVRSHERQRMTTPLLEEPVDRSATAAETAALQARRRELGRMLRELPRVDRQLIARRFLRRETLAEIAAATGVPVSTLHNRERGILARLRTAIEGLDQGGSDG